MISKVNGNRKNLFTMNVGKAGMIAKTVFPLACTHLTITGPIICYLLIA